MDVPASPDKDLTRALRRLERERAARLEAETIAEESVRRLYAANQDLDRRIAERTLDLDRARLAAEQASRAKSSFLAHVSHEVRTPLNGIRGMIELVESAELDPQQRAWLTSANESAERLRRLFVRLLRYVELEGVDATITASARRVEEILDAAAGRWRVRAAAAKQLLGVESWIAPDLCVLASAELDHALDELLENAVTHADPGAVHLMAQPGGPGTVRMGVGDPGPGFVSADFAQELALEPGEAVTTRRDHGQGLGLALAERVAQTLKGRLVVDSSPGRGSEVWLELPAHEPAGGSVR